MNQESITTLCAGLSTLSIISTLDFGISMKEAQQLDPSSRLILEAAQLVCAVAISIYLVAQLPHRFTFDLRGPSLMVDTGR